MEGRAKRQTPARLLIVEDDESQLRTLTAIMQEEGYDVTGCSTASEATEHIKNLDTGVVVLDLHLPDLSGTQLLERLASHNSIRVIIHTAYSSYETARDSLNLGAFAYVEKGGNPQELLRHVHRAFAASFRSYADQLEAAVAQRTCEVRQANESLKKEIARRQNAQENLQEELHTRKVLLGSLPCIAMILRKETREIVTSNERAREAGAITGKTCYETVAERDNPCPFCRAPEVWATNETRQSELDYRGRHYEGTWIPLAEGFYAHYIFDITERRRAQEAYPSLVDLSLQGLAIFQDHRIVFTNQAIAQIAGYSIEEMLAMTFDEMQTFVHPEDQAMVWTRHRDRMDGKLVPEQYEFRGIRKDGSLCWLECHAKLIDYQGKPAIQAAYVDITERKKAESRLSGALAWREAIFEGSLDAVLISDANSKFVTVNNRACELTGYSKQELLGMRIPDLHEEQDLTAYNLYHDRIMSGEDIVSEAMLLRKDGTKIETEFSNRCIRISGEVYMHTVACDITERKKVEDKLRKYQAKLKAMASEILRTEERERKRIAMRLHDNMCQDLVMTKVLLQSTLRLVSDPSVSGPLKMACGAMSELIEQANSLTFELRNPVLHNLGLAPALEKHLTEEVQKKHGIAFELEGDEQLRLQDEEIKNSLFRISRELLMNIVKHAQAHNVKVSIHKRRSQIRVVIQDDGVGFDSNEVSSTVLRTSRFGLFSIREQLEHLGGTFAIESEPGRGTTATVVVPLGENTLG